MASVAQVDIPLKTETVDSLREASSRLAEEMLASMDLSRNDRLWPADAMVFQTNPLSLAYGASGTLLFLHDTLGEIPPAVRDWILSRPVDTTSYPPGLYLGIAGISWVLAEIGMPEHAAKLFRSIPDSPLTFEAADIFHGAAGCGLAALRFFFLFGDEEYRTLAVRVGDHLMGTARRSPEGAYWPDAATGTVPLGFALGGSGIGLFLLYLYQVTGAPIYKQTAIEAIEFEIAQAKPLDGALVWSTTSESPGHRPYWLRGGAGVAAALSRFAGILKDDRYLNFSQQAVQPCAVFFSAAPHLFEGLASMGESLLDMYLLTGEGLYLRAAVQKAEQALLFQIARPHGIAFPGRYLLRISHDYGLGGAGIGLFFRRLFTLKPRMFHDIGPESFFTFGGSPTLSE